VHERLLHLDGERIARVGPVQGQHRHAILDATAELVGAGVDLAHALGLRSADYHRTWSVRNTGGRADPGYRAAQVGGPMRLRSVALGLALLALGGAAEAAAPGRVAAGADEGGAPQVVARDGDVPVSSFLAYGPTFTGGVRVAVGDVTGDGVADIVTGAGPGGGPHVKVFDGVSGAGIWSFFAFAVDFTGGVYVAAGDVDGDGLDDVIVGAGPGGGPHVKVFAGATQLPLADFFAFSPSFTGGVRVAAGDVNGDGRADLVLGSGPGGGELKVVNVGAPNPLANYLPYASYTGGVFVAAGDLDGDGRAEQVTGTDEDFGAHVKVFDGLTGAAVADFFPYDPNFTGGVRVAVADVDGDRRGDLLLAPGPGGAPTVTRLRGTDQAPLGSFDAFGPSFTGGVFVGGAPVPEPGSAAAAAVAIAGLALRRLASRD
jgi:hypothetical protein